MNEVSSEPGSEAGNPVRILVLDDEPYMVKLLSHMLARLGATAVTTATSGTVALQEMDQAAIAPELILLDLNMPEMDGIEFIRQLVERGYSGSLILVSGEEERVRQTVGKLVRAQGISILGHLHKPVTLEHLEAMLLTWSPALPDALRRPDGKQYPAEELRAAIANGELVNHYQPKVAVATGQVVGVEALVRWRHPVDGLVYPDRFIGIAETHGLIDALTAAVLTEALAQAAAWQQAKMSLRVAVNVSMDNLVSLDFPDHVAALVASAGVAVHDLILEVTESRLAQDLRAVLDILTRLRLKRIDLAIDDFGTGHSSMAQLRDIPFTQLKIDQSFVHGAQNNETSRAIYTASLGLARELGMEVVAEGVEDRDDWDFLRITDCDVAQGYFIARPMPAADLPAWMEQWAQRLQSDFANEP